MKRILVTGGAGFIGSHIVDQLLSEGITVRVLDDLSTGKLENLPFLESGLEFMQGSVADKETVETACRDVDGVVHLAALVSVPASIEQPDLSASTNLLGFINVLDVLRTNGFKGKLLYASSAAVYGTDVGQQAITEDMAPGTLASPYAQDKFSNEMYARLYSDLYGIKSQGFRFFNIYGPRQDPASPYSGVISIFMDRCFSGQDIIVFGDGEQTRDFVYVGDLVQVLRAALDSDGQGVVNVGTGKSTRVSELVEQVQLVCGKNVNVQQKPARAGDIKYSLADTKELQKNVGVIPQTPISEGLQALRDWLTVD